MESLALHPYRYRLSIAERKIVGIRHDKISLKRFNLPSNSNTFPKLYIVKQENKIVYVGITSQRISNRLSYGLQAVERRVKNYKGYAWKDLPEVELLLYIFSHADMKYVEAVEAELVYLVRLNTGEWPMYQTEIHFANNTSARQTAQSIYIQASEYNSI